MEALALSSNIDASSSSSRPGFDPPVWARNLVADSQGPWIGGRDLGASPGGPAEVRNLPVEWRSAETGGFSLVSARVVNALDLDGEGFLCATSQAYSTIAACLRSCRASFPVRFWNLIPGILERLGDHAHRYMAFNAGRREAFAGWAGGGTAPGGLDSSRLPTASGVGHEGRDLVIHCLGALEPGESVENPRQVPSYRYSARFGDVPPCFARATRLRNESCPKGEGPDGRWVLVGGTASVRGEETVHVGDLEAQTRETAANLAALLESAAEGILEPRPGTGELLGCFRHLRVYFVDSDQHDQVRQLVARYLPMVENVEVIRADLCRPDLLIEIEGLAVLPCPA
jgi:chorismate lyase/3-hydroxybenzoate synthase